MRAALSYARLSQLATLLVGPAAATPLTPTTACTRGPCGPGNEVCADAAGNEAPISRFVFHLTDHRGCKINDPNGPMYDPVHQIYHNFYQRHIAEPGIGAAGPDWGHWVSADFLHWHELPTAIWNDKEYDSQAIFSGSATIVDGKPVIVYPGLCDPEASAYCAANHTSYNVAVPADPADRFLTNWSKPLYNPIITLTGDDPSTAWQTEAKEWRMIGNGGLGSGPVMGVGAPIFGSMDFKKWYRIGASELIVGDCPTFMPLPPLTAGSDAALDAQQLASLPSHAHKSGSGDPTAQYPGAPARNRHDDTVEIGSWEDGPVNTTGSWTPCCQRRRLVDAGEMHASKDFWDPVKRRRILWGWGTLGTGFQTLPREVTFDPRLAGGQLVYTPARELAQLRSTEPLAALGKTSLHPGAPPLKLKSGPASEIEVVFGRPSNAANLSISLAGGVVYLNYIPGVVEVTVGYRPAASTLEVGDQFDPRGCNGVAPRPAYCRFRDTMVLLPSDTELSVRLFVDTAPTLGAQANDISIAEAYFGGGRVAMTLPGPSLGKGGAAATLEWEVGVAASGDAALVRATSWAMSAIMLQNKEDVVRGGVFET